MMGAFTFENQGTNTFFVYAFEDEKTLDPLSLGMLTNNKIEGIIPVIYMQMDNTRYLKYNISSKESLQQYFQGMVTKKQFLTVFLSIAKTMLLVEEYMLMPETIMFDMDRIYVNVSSAEAELICLPLLNKNTKVDMGSFFKNIVFTTRFDQNENCDYVTKIINYFNSADHFSLLEFKNLLQEMLESPQAAAASQSEVAATFYQEPVSQPISSTLTSQQGQFSQQTAIETPTQNKTNASSVQSDAQPQAVRKNESQAQGVGQRDLENVVIKKGRIWPFGGKENKKDKKNKDKKEKKGKEKKKKELTKNNSSRQYALGNMQIPNANKQNVSLPTVLKEDSFSNASEPFVKENQKVKTQQTMSTMNFGETIVLSEGQIASDTTVLTESMNPTRKNPYLIRAKTNEEILINLDVFKIGREGNYVDYCIAENSAVGRIHAKIITRGQEVYIIDNNSRNHTYVNENKIQPNTEYPLTNGCAIRLANEDFEFRLM